MASPTKNSNPKLSNFLKTFCIFRVFEKLSSSIAWRVMLAPIGAKKAMHAELKRLPTVRGAVHVAVSRASLKPMQLHWAPHHCV